MHFNIILPCTPTSYFEQITALIKHCQKQDNIKTYSFY